MRRASLFLTAAISACASLAQVPAQTSPELAPAMRELTKGPLHAYMAFLADDLLEGRGTGKRGHELASLYLATQFEALGLKPGDPKGGFYQSVPLRQTTADPKVCAAQITEAGTTSKLAWGTEYLMFGDNGEANATLDAPIVFAGYGIRTPKNTPGGSHDDYAGLDVKGKIVAILYGAPKSLPSELRAHLSVRYEKLRIAREHGAAAVLTLYTPELEKIYSWSNYLKDQGAPATNWVGPDGSLSDQVPGLMIYAAVSPARSERLFEHAPQHWAEVLHAADQPGFHGFPLPLTAHLVFASSHSEIASRNVVAILPGSDPALSHEYVIYSAHVDHVGIGKPENGDSIYNGALDNASGTAALMLIAKAFTALPHPPARSIVFLGVTGEEMGLLGSGYFARFPTVPAGSIVADINFDGIPLFQAYKDIIAYGGDNSSLGDVVKRQAAALGLKVSPDPLPEEVFFVRSDQYSFVREGIPSLALSDGFETVDPKINALEVARQWEATRYHRPSDDMAQPLNFDVAEPFLKVNFLIGYEVAQNPKRPTWNPGDFFGQTFARPNLEPPGAPSP